MAHHFALIATHQIQDQEKVGLQATQALEEVNLALKALKGEMGYPTALSAKFWGFEDVSMRGKKSHC